MAKGSMKASSQAVKVFTLLSLLVFVGFLNYAVISLSKIISSYIAVCEPVALLMIILSRELVSLLWITALLIIFGVKVDKTKVQQFI